MLVGLELKDTLDTNLKKIKLFLSVLSIFFIYFFSRPGFAQDVVSDLQSKINEYNQKIAELSKAKDTLANQVSYLTSQVNLTLLKIEQTQNSINILETEIESLTGKIEQLDIYLNHLSNLLIHQINQSYKISKKITPLAILVSGDLNSFLAQRKYLASAQQSSQKTLLDMETVRTNYDLQKQQKEQKQQELKTLENTLAKQKADLASQKEAKSNLLTITKNDEKKYQQLKTEAERELTSLLQAKFVGKRQVKTGEALGTMGNTGYSFGDHLHFGLYDLAESQLSSWTYQNDIDPSSYLSDHRWPMDEPIRITQGRGVTQYSYLYSDRFHHGIDMVSENKTIMAVNDGVAYFFRNPNSSLGNHVKLFHADGKMTLYLHMK